MKKRNIALVYGGYSSEEIISRKSAEGILGCLDSDLFNVFPLLITKNKWVVILDGAEYPVNRENFTTIIDGHEVVFDCAYITIHGTPGEDGLLQGYLQMVGIPHTTCDVLPASITFNKFTCNNYLKTFGVQVAKSVMVTKDEKINSAEIVKTTGLPCFVKPNAGGSSFGITKVKKIEEMEPAIKKAFNESSAVIIEQYIEGVEVTCGLYKTSDKVEILPLTEVVSQNEFFDYEAKYTPGKADEITPARINAGLTKIVQEQSLKIYEILGCRGVIRADYIISGNLVYLLEVNTTPGMTSTSFIPQQIKAKGLNPQKVFTEIIEDAISSYKMKIS